MWPDEILDRVNQDIITNGALINSVNSEPDLGSPSRGGMPTTTARAHTARLDHQRAKALGEPGPGADLHADPGHHRRWRCAPAARQFPGSGIRLLAYDVDKTWDNLGMRGTASDDVVFTDVEVPLDALVPVDGSPVPGDGLGWSAFGGAAVFLGIGQAARDAAIQFARERRPNGMAGPIAELQTIQHRIAAIELDLLQARTLLYATAEWWTERPQERPANMWRLAAAKYAVTNAVIRATDEALRVAGSAGLAATSPLQRYFRDARTAIGQPPIEDVALTTIGKAALGLGSMTGNRPPAEERASPFPATAGIPTRG